MTNSMLHKWNYAPGGEVCYSDEKGESYKKAAEFLGDTDSLEDWGCGTGWAKRYFPNLDKRGLYKGIDGSIGYVKEAIDLVNYTSNVDNILMRQVLEFNHDWKKILENVKKSFRKKFCLIICLPLSSETHVIFVNPVYDGNGKIIEGEVPEISFNKQDILDFFKDCKVREETVSTHQNYGTDWILYVNRT